MQWLVLIIVHTPPCEAKKVSTDILFFSEISESCETFFWNVTIAPAVALPRVSIATEMLTKAFSDSLIPNQIKKHKEWNAVGLSTNELLHLVLWTNVCTMILISQLNLRTKILGVEAPKTQIPDQSPGNFLWALLPHIPDHPLPSGTGQGTWKSPQLFLLFICLLFGYNHQGCSQEQYYCRSIRWVGQVQHFTCCLFVLCFWDCHLPLLWARVVWVGSNIWTQRSPWDIIWYRDP